MKIKKSSRRALRLLAVLCCFSVSDSYASSSQPQVSSQTSGNQISTRIVGGSEARAQDWPWMTAYVFTFQNINTSLSVDGQFYNSSYFNYSPSGQASGALVNCQTAANTCANAQAKICLIQRGDNTFADKASKCEAGGGIGAIIYNNEAGQISGTLGSDFSGTIPVIAVTQSVGNSLLNQIGKQASLRVSIAGSLQQDASCGATFLGERWVLTAAHCVDSPDAINFKMNVGEFDLSDGAENASSIARIYIHPQYDAQSIDYDVALVELTESINAPAVTLADQATTDLYAANNSIATVAGWGGRVGYAPGEGPTSDFPDTLHQVDLSLVTNQQCRQILADTYNTTASEIDLITPRMICAAQDGSGKGSCQGDSGGPLIIQTSTGAQQVGIVSWGLGCAEPGYPGVYTRVAEFNEWINALKNGVAIEQQLDFGVAPAGVRQSGSLQISNNSAFTLSLNFSVSNAQQFTISSDTCSSVAAGQTCRVNLSFNSTTTGQYSGQLTIGTDNPAVATSSALLSGQTISRASNLDSLTASSSQLSWYSGGDKPWLSNPLGGIQSGDISDQQQSIVSVYIQAAGSLNFEWSVSSEENSETPDEPYDALYLYVNNQLIEYISGEVEFASYSPSVQLTENNNLVTWIYRKDPATSEGDDTAYLRNVRFTPIASSIPDTGTTSGGSGGGSVTPLMLLAWLVLSLFAANRRNKPLRRGATAD